MHRWLPILLLTATAHPAVAQRTVRFTIGATRSGDLVHDAVLDQSRLQLAVAPTATVGLALPINAASSYRVVLEAALGSSKLSASDANGGPTDLGRVTTIGTSATLDGRIDGPLRWQAGVGVLFYRPAISQGVFLAGGTSRYMVTGGLSWSHPLASRLDLLLLGRYAFHEFRTATLVSRGYSSYQSVHRIGLQVGLERRF